MHQVLFFFVLLLHDMVVRSLNFLDQGEEELEFLLVEGILHGEHIIVLLVKN